MCLDMYLYEFILLEVRRASWMCRLMFVIKFWKNSAINFFLIFGSSLSLLSDTSYIYDDALNDVSYSFEILFIFFLLSSVFFRLNTIY